MNEYNMNNEKSDTSHNGDNIENFLPVQTFLERVDDKAIGIHFNEHYRTEYLMC